MKPKTNPPPPPFTAPRRVWLDISLDSLCRNCRRIAAAVAPCRMLAVLKANAYGLGVRPIAEALAREGIAGFGVAEPREVPELLDLGLPVQILGSVLPGEIPGLVAAGATLPVADPESARAISREAVRQGRTVPVHFKIDTGMGRLGLLGDGAAAVIRTVCSLPGLLPEGIYSHFPAACPAEGEYTRAQIGAFTTLLDTLAAAGIRFEKRHIANSDAIASFPETCREPFNLVRTGINLYGAFTSEGRRALGLEPVLALKTRLAAVRTLPAGAAIGYGLTCRLPRRTRVGTLAAGYADGLPLALSNRGHVLIRGAPCPILGRLSMDYTTVSLEAVPDAAVGDEATCLGGEGPQAVRVEDWAALKGTHAYDILCAIGPRVERRYH